MVNAQAMERAADQLTGLGVDGPLFESFIGIVGCAVDRDQLGADCAGWLEAYADLLDVYWVELWLQLRQEMQRAGIHRNVSDVLEQIMGAARGERRAH